MAFKLVDTFAGAAKGFTNLPVVRQIGLLFGLSASIAIGFSVVLWMGEPNYYPLYSNLPLESANEIIDALQKSGIKHKLDSQNGTILVPSDQVYQARINLASAGLPKNNQLNFSNIDKTSWVGNSGFVENMRYKLALENELAHTISAIQGIKEARVHLALPKQSEFIGETSKPSASVLVELSPGASLEKGQVKAIVQMVASSVTGLKPEDVSVADQEGRLLTTDLNDGINKTKEQFAYQKELQNDYKRRLEAILVPLLGVNKVRAQVAIDIDFTQQEQTKESFLPKDQVIRSEQTLIEQKTSSGSSGVPGASTNQPGSNTIAQSGADTSNLSKNNSTRNFEVGKTIEYSKAPFGKITRMNIAVVVDDHTKVDPATGKVTRIPLTPKEVKEVTELAKNSIGFDQKRGDEISVINIPFAPPTAMEVLPPLKIWEHAWFWEIVKKATGALFIMLLALLVLRPTLRSLARLSGDKSDLPEADSKSPLTPDSLSEMSAADILKLKQQRLETLQQMVNQDPSRVAQVLKTWVGE